MTHLPLIVGMGGINAAGRSSGFHAYKRMIFDVLPEALLANTWRDLAHRMGYPLDSALNPEVIEAIKNGTLIRKINLFDTNHVRIHHPARIEPGSVITKKSKSLNAHATQSSINIDEPLDVLIPSTQPLLVTSAGMIPDGFDPGALYNAHHHPRGLKLTIYGASDVLNHLGIEWSNILAAINPDEISVYAGSALGQIDAHSLAGLIAQPLLGQRINSKMMAMSLAEMPADFINSYVINSIGSTGNNMGACATFLYNLRQGMQDIQNGKAKVVIVGNAEAPITPEIIDGFRVMGALATDEELCALDGVDKVHHRRACRPFSTNVGFTLAESSQFVVLMNDALALELGVTIYGSVADVFINADGNKKSIASPGVGNYVTVAKAAALAKSLLGQSGLNQTYVHAHGTGTPQNRVTESHLLNEVAKTFSIKHWPVTAVKAYFGHSVGVAGGDQLMSALGTWQYGWIPGITSIDHIASDVHHSHLNILTEHCFVGENGQNMQATIINAKGFGGNNASALILSPQKTLAMLTHKYGRDKIKLYQQKNEPIKTKQKIRDEETCMGQETIVYQFGTELMDESDVKITPTSIQLSAFSHPIHLPTEHPYGDYQDATVSGT